MDHVWEWLSPYAHLLALVLGLAPFFAAAWVLFPLDRLARWKRVRYQFMVVDYFSLVLLIQLPLAAKHAIYAPDPPSWSAGSYWGFDVILCLVSGLIWWTGVRTFGQAGIRDTRTRAILGLVVLPVAFFGALTGLALLSMTGWRVRRGLLVPLGSISILISMILCGRYTRRLENARRLDVGDGSATP